MKVSIMIGRTEKGIIKIERVVKGSISKTRKSGERKYYAEKEWGQVVIRKK